MARVWIRRGFGRRRLVSRTRIVIVPACAAGRPEAALRIEQEHSCRYDLVACFQAIADFDAISDLRTNADGAGLEPSPVATNTCCCSPLSTSASRGTVIRKLA